jgi:hypothetical protein
MVPTTGTQAGTRAIRALNQPEPLDVAQKEHGFPALLVMGSTRQKVASVESVWRIEDEWWRDEPVSRTYFEVLTADGWRITLFHDHVSGRWFRQRY